MSVHASDLHGDLLLKRLARRQRAKAVLWGTSAPKEAAISILMTVLGAIAGAYFSSNVVLGVVVAFILVGMWRLERRLAAVIVLLKSDDDAQH